MFQKDLGFLLCTRCSHTSCETELIDVFLLDDFIKALLFLTTNAWTTKSSHVIVDNNVTETIE